MLDAYQSTPNWPAVYFHAASANEAFDDVDVVTARSQYFDLVYQAAAESVYLHTGTLSTHLVETAASILMDSNKIFVHEYVKVHHGDITVCLDVADTLQDDAMWRAVDLVKQALDQLDGSDGTVWFGEKLRFSPTESLLS